MDQGPLPLKRIRLYATLQALTLAGCWLWFALLWSVALFTYTLGDVEWWVLVAAASAGLYGLRPNLERAIDSTWLQGVRSSAALAERVAQLKPVKRRIDIIFSAAVLLLVGGAAVLWLL